MAKYNYSTKIKEDMASAVLRSAAISTKHSIEIANFVRGKDVAKVKDHLSKVISKQKPIPFKRFNWDVGHKKGNGSARYPVKAAESILSLIKSAEANAQDKGLGKELMISHIAAHKASRPMRLGRHRGREGKASHVELVLREKPKKQDKKTPAKKEKSNSGAKK
ncbi:MAG: 50S ribosomal protein L22 [Nanobdellota archaeon]